MTYENFSKRFPKVSQEVYEAFKTTLPGIGLDDSAIISAFISGYMCAKNHWMKKYDELRSEISLLRENSMMKEPK